MRFVVVVFVVGDVQVKKCNALSFEVLAALLPAQPSPYPDIEQVARAGCGPVMSPWIMTDVFIRLSSCAL